MAVLGRLIRVGKGCLRAWTALLLLACVFQEVAAQELQITLRTTNGEAVAGAVAEILLPESLAGQYREPRRVQIDQVNKEFVPTITTIVAGSDVSFPNSDDILHHVYSFSSARTFNIPLYGKGENDDYFETFPRPGIVEIGCNIHDWMLAYIYVGESNLMAVSDDDGALRLVGLPEGEFQVRLWHDRLDAENNMQLHQVQLTTGTTTRLELNLGLERDRRLRRAPSANRSRYR